MNFGTAVSTCFTKYVDFSGRARRSEYWWYYLFFAIVYLVAAIISAAIGSQIVLALVILALFLPTLAAGIRRLHDTGRTGWWVLIGIIPIAGAIVLLVFFCTDSEPGANQYGPSPKQLTGGPGAYPTQPGGGYPQGPGYPPPPGGGYPQGPGYPPPPGGGYPPPPSY